MNAIKYKATVKNGKLTIPDLDLPEGTVVEAILLIETYPQTDETEYLLSTEANRLHLKEALNELNQPENYVYVNPETL
jgi:antitoxin YefM